jgi:GNAT superfamily N-acetyltransferase
MAYLNPKIIDIVIDIDIDIIIKVPKTHKSMKPIHFLPASPNDASVLTQISFTSKRHWGYPEAWIEQWRETLTVTPDYIRRHAVYKLEKEDRVIGFCSVEKHPDYLEIGHLWLLPGYIGRGFGRFLLDRTLQAVAAPGALIRVEADPNAEAFYRRQGFVQVAQTESYPPGRWLPVLEKTFMPVTKDDGG